MSPSDILTVLAGMELTAKVKAGQLVVGPKAMISEDIRRLILGSKQGLINLLESQQVPPDPIALDTEIVRNVAMNNDAEVMRTRMMRCVRRHLDTGDGVWAEAACYWSQALSYSDSLRSTPTQEAA